MHNQHAHIYIHLLFRSSIYLHPPACSLLVVRMMRTTFIVGEAKVAKIVAVHASGLNVGAVSVGGTRPNEK